MLKTESPDQRIVAVKHIAEFNTETGVYAVLAVTVKIERQKQ